VGNVVALFIVLKINTPSVVYLSQIENSKFPKIVQGQQHNTLTIEKKKLQTPLAGLHLGVVLKIGKMRGDRNGACQTRRGVP
jgi:hypothetical protein